VCRRGQYREPLQTERSFPRSTHGREWCILEAPVGVESRSARLTTELELDERAFLELVHLQLHAEEALHDLEPELRRGEEHAVVAGAKPDRASDAARDRDRVLAPLVDPGGRHRAAESPERLGGALGVGGDGEDRLGVDRHSGLSPRTVVIGEQLVVVENDPVVDANDRAVADRVIVCRDGRMALRVVPDMNQEFGRTLRNGDLVEQRARARTLLVHRHALAGRAVGVTDGVGAALGDSRQESLSRERPLERARGSEAISGDSAHINECRTPNGRSS